MEDEARRYSKFCNRAKTSQLKNCAREETARRFPNVPQDNVLFPALVRLQADSPWQLSQLPINARSMLGGTTVDHEDTEYDSHQVCRDLSSTVGLSQSSSFSSTIPTPSPATNSSGITVRGRVQKFANGIAFGHARSAAETFTARTGLPLSPAQMRAFAAIPMPPENKVRFFIAPYN